MYNICKNTVILALFEAILLEDKYIACEIINKLSLNTKNCAFRGPNKTHPSGLSETVVVEGIFRKKQSIIFSSVSGLGDKLV